MSNGDNPMDAVTPSSGHPAEGELEFPGGRAMVLHNFAVDEIRMIMRMVKKNMPGTDIIFAKSTKSSLKLKLGVLLADMSEDHQYLKDNPPPLRQKQAPATDVTR